MAGSPYPITPSAAVGTGLTNYTITYVAGALTVSPAALTITADDRTKPYGQTVTFAGTEFTSTGLLNTDTVDSRDPDQPGCSRHRHRRRRPYPITRRPRSAPASTNYTITYVNGAPDRQPAALTITADDQTKTYGRRSPSPARSSRRAAC